MNYKEALEFSREVEMRDVSTSAYEDIWEADVIQRTRITEANYVEVYGKEAAEVRIIGLDEAYNVQSETLRGAFKSSKKYLRLLYMKALSSKDITATISGAVQACVKASEREAKMSHFTVPAGYTAFVFNSCVECYKMLYTEEKEAEILRKTYCPHNNRENISMLKRVSNNRGASVFPTETFREKTDFWFEAKASKPHTALHFEESVILIKN